MENKTNTGLNGYKKVIHSQWGEDGIIEEIFNRIGTRSKFCVEFGAGDGYEMSNTWHLINTKQWKALLIDGDVGRYERWLPTLKTKPLAKIINEFIEIDGEQRLDNVLARNNVPVDLDLLSIDIDSDDHHIWKSLEKYRPRVLIIEHNPTIPPGDAIVQEPKEKGGFGASAQANVDLAHTKGYSLVAATHTNCIFVIKSEFEKLKIAEPDLRDVFSSSGLSYVISAYNGALYLKTPDPSQNPPYGWLYKSYSFSLKKTIHAFTFGFSLNSALSKTLSNAYLPIKMLRIKQSKENKK